MENEKNIGLETKSEEMEEALQIGHLKEGFEVNGKYIFPLLFTTAYRDVYFPLDEEDAKNLIQELAIAFKIDLEELALPEIQNIKTKS